MLEKELQELYWEIESKYYGNSEEIEPWNLVKNPDGDIISQEQAQEEINKAFIKELEEKIISFLEDKKIGDTPTCNINL